MYKNLILSIFLVSSLTPSFSAFAMNKDEACVGEVEKTRPRHQRVKENPAGSSKIQKIAALFGGILLFRAGVSGAAAGGDWCSELKPFLKDERLPLKTYCAYLEPFSEGSKYDASSEEGSRHHNRRKRGSGLVKGGPDVVSSYLKEQTKKLNQKRGPQEEALSANSLYFNEEAKIACWRLGCDKGALMELLKDRGVSEENVPKFLQGQFDLFLKKDQEKLVERKKTGQALSKERSEEHRNGKNWKGSFLNMWNNR